MKNEDAGKPLFLVLIAGRKQKDALLTILLESGAHLIDTLYGRGSVKAGFLSNMLGLIPEEHKVVITCAVSGVKAEAILNLLTEKFHFDRPNTGIAFTVPVNRLSY